MGTRSTTTIIEKRGENKTPILKLYIQFDGYPSGVGLKLAEFSKDIEIINGISDQVAGKAANGAGCFAAQLVGKLKGNDIGGVYITEVSACNEEYNYELICEEGQPVKMTCKEAEFNGTAKEFYNQFS